MFRRCRFRHVPLALLIGLCVVFLRTSPAAEPSPLEREQYQLPPKEIAEAVEALSQRRTVLTNLSPDGEKFLIAKSDGLPPIARVGRPHVHLGGLALDPIAARAHDLWVRSSEGLELFFFREKKTVPVSVPDGARVANPLWSPDGSQLAFLALFDTANHLYVADAATGKSRQVTESPILATLATSFQWTADGKAIQTVLMPEAPSSSSGSASTIVPKVRVARSGPQPSRTYRYLLETTQDMEQLERLATGQLALVSVADGQVTKVGEPAMIRSVNPSPEGKSFRVSVMKKPFSYYVPATSFGSMESIWDNAGKNLLTLNDRNLRDTRPTVDPKTVVAKSPTPMNPMASKSPADTPMGPRTGRTGRGTPGAGAPNKPMDPDPVDPDPNDPKDPNAPTDPDDPPARTGPSSRGTDPNARRDLAWRPDGKGMTFLQQEPAEEGSKEPRKDRVMLWTAPFGKDDAKPIFESTDRILSLAYSEDCNMLFLTQTVKSQRQITAIDLKDGNKAYVIHRSGQTPSRLETAPAPRPTAAKPPAEYDTDQPWSDDEQFRGRGTSGLGGATLLTKPSRGTASIARISSDASIYITGSDRGPNGISKPYLEKIAIKTGKKTRLFQGKGEMTESIDGVDGDDARYVFTTRQSSEMPPNTFVTELATGKSEQLTQNEDPAPWAKKLHVQRFRVTRNDGFRFWVKVTTPDKDAKNLPALFWIYPREYVDQAAYDARSGGSRGATTSGRFTVPGVRSMTLLCLLGYAVVEPDVPIVGPEGRMNDNYIPDLRNSLWAVIDDLDKKGIIDRDRLACGGHSYGAFSTANAMAHTPFFKAGIAGDGNYNRTLTTMSFQSERRHLWDAREMYLEMSPLLWANRVSGALLMYHGMDDANVGTAPINAELMFLALDGLGKPASLYMYPYEGHGPIAKETTLDLWSRWTAWLDQYVKNPKKDGAE